MEPEDGDPIAKLLGHYAQTDYQHLNRGPVQRAAVSCHMGRVFSIPCRLDTACDIVPVPAVRRAQCNDLRGRTGSSAHAMGYCKNGGVDMFCLRAHALGYVVFGFRSVGLAAKSSRVEVPMHP